MQVQGRVDMFGASFDGVHTHYLNVIIESDKFINIPEGSVVSVSYTPTHVCSRMPDGDGERFVYCEDGWGYWRWYVGAMYRVVLCCPYCGVKLSECL